MPINVLALGNDPLSNATLLHALKSFPDFALAAQATELAEFQRADKDLIDLAIIDFEFALESGVTDVEQLSLRPETDRILISDHVGNRPLSTALAVLKKPLRRIQLAAALEMARARALARRMRNLSGLLASYAGLSNGACEPRPLALQRGQSLLLLDAKDVEWIESDGNYVNSFGANGPQRIRATLTEIEQSLDPHVFARIHRKRLVNLSKVAQVNAGHDGNAFLVLTSGKQLKMSRQYRNSICDRVRTFLEYSAVAPISRTLQ